MDGKKVYQIEINGLKESIDQIESLRKQLDMLSAQIDALEKKTISIKVDMPSTQGVSAQGVSTNSSSSNSTRNTSSLNEEVALEKEINKLKNEGVALDAKIAAAQTEVYQKVQATKDLYKETIEDQKQLAAQERLTANAYSNTMQGMKQHLADLKTALNTTDLGDSDKIKQMTQEANELTNKLKQMEEAYGQFGRNVGNYQDAVNGFNKISVVVNGVTTDFDNLRQAQRALANAMGALEINGKKDTAMYKEMDKELEKVAKAQLRLNSTMNDAKASSKAMDDLLDTMQSYTALQQVGRGFSTFFGIDNTAIEQQIAKLVALQNALQGIEKIRQQMNTGEGIGGWFKDANIDKFVANLGGAQIKMGKLVASTKSWSVALNGVAKTLNIISGLLKTMGVMAAVSMIGDLVTGFFKWASGGRAAEDATGKLSKMLDKFNENIERSQRRINRRFFDGFIDEEHAAIQSTHLLTQAINDLFKKIDIIKYTDLKIEFFTDEEYQQILEATKGVKNIAEGYTEWELNIEASERALEKLVQKLNVIKSRETYVENSWMPFLSNISKDIKTWINGEGREIKRLGEAVAQNFLFELVNVNKKAQLDLESTGKISEKTARELIRLRDSTRKPEFGTLLEEIASFSDKGEYYQYQIKSITSLLDKLGDKLSTDNYDPSKLAQMEIDSMKDGIAKQRKQIELNRKKEIAEAGQNADAIKAINDKYNRQLIEAEKENSKEMRAVWADLASIRIQLMRDGWEKQKKELEHERDERLRQIAESEKLVGARSAATRELYRKKEKQAERDWAYEMMQINQELINNIENVRKEAFSQEVENSEQSIINKQASKKNNLWESTIDISDPNNVERRKKYYEEILKIDLEASKKQQAIRQENLDKQLEFDTAEEEERHKMVVDVKTVSLVKEELSKIPEPTDEDLAKIEKKLQEQLDGMRGELVDAYNAGKIDFKTFVDYIEREEEAHLSKMNALQRGYNVQTSANTQENLDEEKQLYNTYYTEVLSTIRTRQDEIARGMQKMPVAENDWGVVQISVSSRNYKEALKQYEGLRKDIATQKESLKKDLALDKISAEDFFMKNEELDAMLKSVDEAEKQVKDKQKNLIGDFVQSISTYVQAVGSTINSVIGSLSEITQNQYEAQIVQQEEYISKYEELLQKQEDITKEHADKVNDIEDELKNARGDRRQQLIDQLNAEMAAQRASLSQEKKIEKEKEKAEREKKKLEHDQAVAKKRMDIAQAYINMAMAISMAAVNKWPVPAIPMMALAAAAGAAQIAAIQSQNIPSYGDGGVIQGKSHAQGGVKVLGGRAEVEGGEFITNKVTTTRNVELLEFINTRKKKINLDDMLEFYIGKRSNVKKVITNASPRTRFADGGVIPSLRNDFEFNDRLVDTMEAYANRPVWVAVTDIEDAQANVNYVRTLSGMKN